MSLVELAQCLWSIVCFTFHKVFGLWVGRFFNQLSATKKYSGKAKRDTWSVSGDRLVCYQSFLIVGVCYGGKVLAGSAGNMSASSVTRLPVLSVGWWWKAWVSVDQMQYRWRHYESQDKVQIWTKTSILIGLCNFRIGFLVVVVDSYVVDVRFLRYPPPVCALLKKWTKSFVYGGTVCFLQLLFSQIEEKIYVFMYLYHSFILCHIILMTSAQ